MGIRIRRALLGVAAAAVALAVLPAAPAGACSCAGFLDPRDVLRDADAAIVGTFLERHPLDPADPSGETIYTFRVDEAVKGDFGDTIGVHSADNGAECGLSVEEGRREGLFLYDRDGDGSYSSGLCSQIDPDELREAASELPQADGEPPPALVAGGSFGDEHTVGLDPAGRVVAYAGAQDGGAEGEAVMYSSCPDGLRIAALVSAWPQRSRISLRDAFDLSSVREIELDLGGGDDRGDVVGIHCLHPWGRRVVALAREGGNSKLLMLEAGASRVVHEGRARAAAFHGSFAYLVEGRRLLRVSLDTGRERALGRVPPRLSGLSLSPNGKWLAGVAFGGWTSDSPQSRVVLIRVAGAYEVRSRSLRVQEAYGTAQWVNHRRVGYFEHSRSKLYDRRLRVRARLGRWPAHETVVRRGSAYGFTLEWECLCAVVHKMRLRDGVPLRLGELPSPEVHTLAVVR